MAFVAIHLGAGSHSRAKRATYTKLAQKACSRAMRLLKTDADSVKAVNACMACLEDAKMTNAGRGANLTMDGTVELDASVMCSRGGAFGAVACVSRLPNPCSVASAVLRQSCDWADPDGRVPPVMMCSAGCQAWAARSGFPLVDPRLLITTRTQKAYARYKKIVEERTAAALKATASDSSACAGDVEDNLDDDIDCADDGGQGAGYKDDDDGDDDDVIDDDADDVMDDNDPPRLDTVGAVVLDRNGVLWAAVSSGGLALKESGRIGQAALFGCGCWAEERREKQPQPQASPPADTEHESSGAETSNDSSSSSSTNAAAAAAADSSVKVAVSTSGTGEHLIKAQMSQTCASKIYDADGQALDGIRQCMQAFLDCPRLSTVSAPLGGVLAIGHNGKSVEVAWGHTTESFFVGYMSERSDKVHTALSQKPHSSRFAVEGRMVRLS
eukprot:scpid44879/ scgid3661/ Threonine aspartase 1; Threonine aspartase subunit alpha; Threonine aspartase subunit beta